MFNCFVIHLCFSLIFFNLLPCPIIDSEVLIEDEVAVAIAKLFFWEILVKFLLYLASAKKSQLFSSSKYLIKWIRYNGTCGWTHFDSFEYTKLFEISSNFYFDLSSFVKSNSSVTIFVFSIFFSSFISPVVAKE